MEHQELTEELRDELALYALGALEADSANTWEAHLTTDCEACRQELTEIESTLALLPYSLPLTDPPQRVKTRLFERVRDAQPGLSERSTARARLEVSSLEWQPSGVPGISFHWLRRDGQTGATTAFLKMQPGSVFPPHRHPSGEEGLVLQGRCRDDRGAYGPGSYVYYEPGSDHIGLEALGPKDCILFVTAPGGIEWLPAHA